MYRFSIILPFKSDHGHRQENFEYVCNRYQKLMPEIELCIGYTDSEPFCKAQAINEAARKATGDIFIIVDVDVVFEPELLQQINLHLHVHPWIQPFGFCYLLSKSATNNLLIQDLYAKLSIQPQEGQMVEIKEAGPLMNVMTRECFEAVNGFDERFKGWGWEDVAFAYSLDAICGRHYTIREKIYHLWHPSSANPESEEYNRNAKLFYRYCKAAQGGAAEVKKIIQERYQ